MNTIHGHEVMRMMAESGRSYSRAELIRAIQERFGPDARFHTCASEQLTPEQLIDFLESRGKFTATASGMEIDTSRICQ